MKLLPCERETIINLNDAEDTASIYSCQRKVMNQLRNNPLFKLEQEHKDQEGKIIAIEGTLPKRAISIRKKFREKKSV